MSPAGRERFEGLVHACPPSKPLSPHRFSPNPGLCRSRHPTAPGPASPGRPGARALPPVLLTVTSRGPAARPPRGSGRAGSRCPGAPPPGLTASTAAPGSGRSSVELRGERASASAPGGSPSSVSGRAAPSSSRPWNDQNCGPAGGAGAGEPRCACPALAASSPQTRIRLTAEEEDPAVPVPGVGGLNHLHLGRQPLPEAVEPGGPRRYQLS